MVSGVRNIGKEHFLNKLILSKVKKGNFSMEWSMVYISGKPGFVEEVMKNLEGSRFPSMPGTSENDSLTLFWIDERSSLRDFKKAIGSKTIFKYRLHFYPSLEKYYESIRNKKEYTFTHQEKELIYKMSSLDGGKRQYRNSA